MHIDKNNHIGGYYVPEKIMFYANSLIEKQPDYSVADYVKGVESYLGEHPRRDGTVRIIKVLSSFVDYLA